MRMYNSLHRNTAAGRVRGVRQLDCDVHHRSFLCEPPAKSSSLGVTTRFLHVRYQRICLIETQGYTRSKRYRTPLTLLNEELAVRYDIVF